MDHKCQNCLWHGLTSIFELIFLQTKWLHFFFQALNLKFSSCFGKLRRKSLLLIHAVESWWIKNAKILFFWICLNVQTHIISLLCFCFVSLSALLLHQEKEKRHFEVKVHFFKIFFNSTRLKFWGTIVHSS